MALPLDLATVLAQHGGHGSDEGPGGLALTIMLVAVLSAIWIALGVVCWIFWRAKKREDAERARREVTWRNAPSS